jgi:flagellar biosynthesis protein FlhG
MTASLDRHPDPFMAPADACDAPSLWAADQADGLRRQFATRVPRFVPVVSNPELNFGGVLLERLCSAVASRGAPVLVVDASERSSEPKELAHFDLSEGVETLSAQVSYLAARGLAVRHVDSHGSTRAFLDQVALAAPQAQVVLVHAPAGDLARMFSHASLRESGAAWAEAPRPLLLCDDRPAGLTQTYTSLKLLAQRASWRAFDLLLCAGDRSERAQAVVQRLSDCADQFLACVLRRCVRVDPAESAAREPSRELRELVGELLAAAAPVPVAAPDLAAGPLRRAALPSPGYAA